MSSFLFYSSPPPAPHQPQTSFLTPQTTRSNLFATSYSQWPSFQPKSPSPLRSSPNTGNYMRRQDQNDMNSKYSFGGDSHENSDAANVNVYNEVHSVRSHVDALYNTPSTTTDSTVQSTTPAFTFNVPPPVTEPARNPFVFQQRARDSAATSQVSSRISSNRDSRKAGFIDRLRRSRRDERDARGLDSFEKAEYWRDRRERETRLRREASGYDVEAEDDLVDSTAFDAEEGEAELSPIDDERDVAELVDAYYDAESRPGDELMSDDFGLDEEEDYAAAFLEVLSQEHTGIGRSAVGAISRQYDLGDVIADNRGLDLIGDTAQEGDMDVS